MSGSRAQLVTKVLGGVFAGEVRRTVGLRTSRGSLDAGHEREVQRARAIRHAFEDLGPLYIKVGQMLSTRPDICPEYLITEFEHLHQKVNPGPFHEFEAVLDDEFGGHWSRYFRDIDPEPIGCASLAQVYKVTLKNGKPAVVKIQRPGVKKDMLEDMALLGKVVRRIGKRFPDMNEVFDLDAMLDVVFTAMRAELDFTLEADNMNAFRDRVADFETLRIPKVRFASERVLVQSMAPGASIRDIDKSKFSEEQCEAIGRDLLTFMFWTFFVDRKFHADPHPGNIFVSPDGEANMIDWGMVGKVDINLSLSMIVIMLSMSMNDGHTLARAWIDAGRATRRADVSGFLSDMGRFVPGIAGQSLERFNFGLQLTKVLTFSSKRGIATSPQIAILGKGFANLEGSIRYLAPGLSITDVFQDEFRLIIQELAREALGQEAAARTAAQAFMLAFNGPAQLRTILTDAANRDTTVRLGEDMNKRSRQQDRIDARSKQWQRFLVAVAAGYAIHRKRS
ncbi:MAG: ABC1 kinase family protein [Sporichthyaceae bacterium]